MIFPSRWRRDGETGGRSKNYDLCSRVFDVSNSTIIKTSESLKNGARYLAAVQATTKEACERKCCSTDSCNVAVLEKGGDCFLFDCGSLDDFKCSFAVHSNYVAFGMMVNRVDLEKTRIHEQAKHEMDLKILKAPGQPVTTTAAVANDNEKRPLQQLDDQNPRGPPLQQPANYRIGSPQQQPSSVVSNNQPQQLDNGVFPYDYSQQFQQRQPPDGRAMQQGVPVQRVGDRPSLDTSGSYPSNQQLQQSQQLREPVQRIRPAVDDPAPETARISKPQALVNSRIDQPQRPPIFSEPTGRQKMITQGCNSYQWACASGDQCIAVYDRCSGIVQCADGSDEQNCDQIQNVASDRSNYDGGVNKISQQQQNADSWGQYYKGGDPYATRNQQSNRQQQIPDSRQPNRNGYNVDQQSRPRQDQLVRTPVQTDSQGQSNQRGGLDQGARDKPPPEDPDLRGPANKEPRVEFISVQKLDSSADINGSERASLAIVMLGLGIAILATLLLFLSCRLRKLRRRVRRGKVLDTEEGEFLVNGMYL